jgi:hypothetical protein
MHAAALVQPSMKSFRAALIGCMASQWLLISNKEFARLHGCARGSSLPHSDDQNEAPPSMVSGLQYYIHLRLQRALRAT